MFAGVLHYRGFVDYFDNIMPINIAKYRYFLKGSSGSGKGTLMKKIANELKKDYEIEYFNCANDVDSLDAIAIQNKGFCILDATNPHSRDPKIPIAIDKIIDLAIFLKKDKLIPHIDKIKVLEEQKSKQYKNIALNLRDLEKLYKNEILSLDSIALDKKELYDLSKKYLDYKKIDKIAIHREFFLDVITENGHISLAENFFKDSLIYSLDFNYNSIDFLYFLYNRAKKLNISSIRFYNPISPKYIKHLYFPNLKIAFIINDEILKYKGKIDKEIYIFKNKFNKGFDDDSVYNNLKLSIKNAKKIHYMLEEIYSNSIDYYNLDNFTNSLIKEIEFNLSI